MMMLTHPIMIEIEKRQSQPSGLYLHKDEKSRIVINAIQNGGIFSSTRLKPSMEIISVNGIYCNGNDGEMTEEFVKALIDETDGQLTIIAREIIYNAILVNQDQNNDSRDINHDQQDDGEEQSSTDIQENRSQQRILSTHRLLHATPISTSMNGQDHQTQNIMQGENANCHNDNIANTMNTISLNNIVHNANDTGNPPPPHGCRSDGRWSKIVIFKGNRTCLLFVALGIVIGCFNLFSPCSSLCPQERQNVYVVDDNVYNGDGNFLGKVSNFQFASS